MNTLSNLSKVFEKLIFSQINTCMSDKFSKHQTGFRKNHNTQHGLLNMTENRKSDLNKRNKIGEKTSFENVFKTSSRRLANMSSKLFQDVLSS